MAYQTGSLTDLLSLKTAIYTFLTSNGWTQNGQVVEKGNVFVRLHHTNSSQSHIKVYGGTGKDGGNNLLDEEIGGTLPDRKFNIQLGTYTYHFFLESTPKDQFYCIVNYGLQCGWICFGEIVKMGIFTGLGTYFGASYYSTIDTGTGTSKWFSYGAGTTDGANNGELVSNMNPFPFMATNSVSQNCILQCELYGDKWVGNTGQISGSDEETCLSQVTTFNLNMSGHNEYNSQAVLVPFYLTGMRGNDDLSFFGYIDQIRNVRQTDFNIADLMTIGADQWMIFPGYKRGFTQPNGTGWPSGANDSGLHGTAIKYNV